MHIDELKRLMQNFPGGHREPPLPDSSETVPFGKHRGEYIQVLLDDIRYCGWIVRQDGMVEDLTRRYPMFGAALVSAVGTGAPALSKEEKAEKRAEMRRQAEEKRAQRAARQALRERSMSSAQPKPLRIIEWPIITNIRQRLGRVTAADLEGATAGQRYLHELVTEAYKRSVQILAALPRDASDDVLNQAKTSLRALWIDLPEPPQWWFGKDPVSVAKRRLGTSPNQHSGGSNVTTSVVKNTLAELIKANRHTP